MLVVHQNTHKKIAKKTKNCSQLRQKTVEHKVPHTKFNTSTNTKVHKKCWDVYTETFRIRFYGISFSLRFVSVGIQFIVCLSFPF